MIMKKIITLLAAALCLFGCKNQKALLPSVSGKAGEILVVMEKTDWEGNLGVEVRELLASECPYLTPNEPLYSLVNIVPSKFVDLFRVHRNIIIFNVSAQADTTGVIYKHDVWAAPQCVIQVTAPSIEAASAQLERSEQMIAGSFEQAERDRVIRNSIRYEEYQIRKQVSEVFGGSPYFPSGYSLRKLTPNFAWIADEKQFSTQGVLMYKYPAGEEDPFSKENIIRHRNETFMANVPGMFENTYMTTSRFFEPTVEYLKYRGRDLAQTRGYWEVENDFMGGPFVSHSFYSKDGSEIIVLDAFVYAPRYDKRQYLRQVESIIYSWVWSEDQEENMTKK